MRERWSCAVVGLGNIGSHTADLAARLSSTGRVILVDFDRVGESNLSAQRVRSSDIGRSKATTIGRRLRASRSNLEVVAHVRRLEDVPLGRLRADVVLGCLDSRAARMTLNERVRALGAPLIDAGVSASGLLARVGTFGASGPCLECSWGEDDYASLETTWACDGAAVATVPTRAPAFLGAAAAALQVAAFAEIVRSGTSGEIGAETILDLENGRIVASAIRERPDCRLAPHRPWTIERETTSADALPLEAVFERGARPGARRGRAIRCARGPFATRLRCTVCDAERSLLRLASSLTPGARRCRACGGLATPVGLGLREWLERDSLNRGEVGRSLAELGARVGDVFTVDRGEGGLHHFEIVAPSFDGSARRAR